MPSSIKTSAQRQQNIKAGTMEWDLEKSKQQPISATADFEGTTYSVNNENRNS